MRPWSCEYGARFFWSSSQNPDNPRQSIFFLNFTQLYDLIILNHLVLAFGYFGLLFIGGFWHKICKLIATELVHDLTILFQKPEWYSADFIIFRSKLHSANRIFFKLNYRSKDRLWLDSITEALKRANSFEILSVLEAYSSVFDSNMFRYFQQEQNTLIKKEYSNGLWSKK